MSFSQMVEILKRKHKEEILFIKLGAFYIATAQDAIFLNSLLNLKCTCYKNRICKVGVPVGSLQKYYYRYLDDSVILVKTKVEAKECLGKIRRFLREKLELELNQKTQIFRSKQGVNFCGYKINEYRLKIRDRGKRKLKKKVKNLNWQIKMGDMTSKEAKKYLAGHMWYIKIANVYDLTNKLFEKE